MERLAEGRDYDPQFETPAVKHEFCHVNPGTPWYMDVKQSDLPMIFHCMRTALRWAENPLLMDSTGSHRVPQPGELKVRWTLAPDPDKGEYIIMLTYLWPVRVSIRDQAILAHYCPTALNWDMTGWVSDDVRPRQYVIHVYQLPYPPVDIFRSKMFCFWPVPVLHLTGPVVGIEKDDMTRPARGGRKAKRPKSWGQTIAGLVPFVGSKTDEEEDESMDIQNAEPASKKRKRE